MDGKEFLKESLYSKLENCEDHNLFNNLNNFTRDEWVFNVTVDACFDLFIDSLEERSRAYKARDYFYKKHEEGVKRIKELETLLNNLNISSHKKGDDV